MRVADRESTFGPPSAWRFSNLGKCLRCQILQRLGFASGAYGSRTLFVFRMGHMIEDMAMEWLTKSSDVHIVARQVPVSFPQFGSKGTMDALAIGGNRLFPIEVKSTRDKALEYRIPYRTHELQAGAYAWAVNLPEAYLVYIGRDGKFIQSKVIVTDQLKNDIEGEWRKLNSYWHSIPKRYTHDEVIEDDDHYYNRLEAGFLPPPPPLVPIVDELGNPLTYQKSGSWGPAGTPKMKLDRSQCPYCMFPKLCCPGDDS